MRNRSSKSIPTMPRRLGLKGAALAEVSARMAASSSAFSSRHASARGSVFVPMHWTDQYASSARVDTLVAGNADPVSGQPELKATAVAVRRLPRPGMALL